MEQLLRHMAVSRRVTCCCSPEQTRLGNTGRPQQLFAPSVASVGLSFSGKKAMKTGWPSRWVHSIHPSSRVNNGTFTSGQRRRGSPYTTIGLNQKGCKSLAHPLWIRRLCCTKYTSRLGGRMPGTIKLSEYFVGLLIGQCCSVARQANRSPRQNSWRVFAMVDWSF